MPCPPLEGLPDALCAMHHALCATIDRQPIKSIKSKIVSEPTSPFIKGVSGWYASREKTGITPFHLLRKESRGWHG